MRSNANQQSISKPSPAGARGRRGALMKGATGCAAAVLGAALVTGCALGAARPMTGGSLQGASVGSADRSTCEGLYVQSIWKGEDLGGAQCQSYAAPAGSGTSYDPRRVQKVCEQTQIRTILSGEASSDFTLQACASHEPQYHQARLGKACRDISRARTRRQEELTDAQSAACKTYLAQPGQGQARLASNGGARSFAPAPRWNGFGSVPEPGDGEQVPSARSSSPERAVAAAGATSAATVPSATAPSAAAPSAAVSSAAVSSAAVSSATVPSAAVPSATVPSAAVPSATVPSATVPSATVPSVPAATAAAQEKVVSGSASAAAPRAVAPVAVAPRAAAPVAAAPAVAPAAATPPAAAASAAATSAAATSAAATSAATAQAARSERAQCEDRLIESIWKGEDQTGGAACAEHVSAYRLTRIQNVCEGAQIRSDRTGEALPAFTAQACRAALAPAAPAGMAEAGAPSPSVPAEAPAPPGLDEKAIASTVDANWRSIGRDCSAVAPRSRSLEPMNVSVSVTLDVAVTGRVQAVVVRARGYRELETCIEESVRGWVFPAAERGTEVGIPLVFAGQ